MKSPESHEQELSSKIKAKFPAGILESEDVYDNPDGSYSHSKLFANLPNGESLTLKEQVGNFLNVDDALEIYADPKTLEVLESIPGIEIKKEE